MASSLIGALHAVLGLDTAAFEKGIDVTQREMRRMQREFEKAGKKLQSIGKDLSTYITLPIIGAGAATLKMAGDFEAGMNRVAISTGAGNEQLAQMKALALDIGKETTKSASESADAMDMLAKAGMRVEDILNGGARAAVALSEAAGSDLDPAAAAITDTMAQFKKTTADLPRIINNITGAVNESKFDFADFQMGMAQAGGVAASAGVDFEDFTAALAGTASQFGSGSDAGTSLKTLIMRMTPDTKKAAEAMREYGVSFYDTEGRMKSMADIAQMLQDKFGSMAEEDRTAIFKAMFGTDAIRSAIGLMDMGAKGFEDMQARIQATDASAQAAQRMQGFNAEMEKLKGAIETLAIAIADSGLLAGATALVSKIAEWVDWMSQAHPTTLKWVAAIAGVAAVIGPLVTIFGGAFKAIGVLLPLISSMATLMGGLIPIVAALGRALMMLMVAGGPLTLLAAAVVGIYLAWKNWDKINAIVEMLVSKVEGLIGKKLASILRAVLNPIEAVRKGFFALYDAVVGHSYIPDMVDGIRDQMARLDAVMVEPAKKGAEAAKEAFRQLQQEVRGLMARLFPEADAYLQFQANHRLIDDALKANILNADQAAEAFKRLKTAGLDAPKPMSDYLTAASDQPKDDYKGGPITIPGMEDWPKELDRLLAKPAKETTTSVVESFANMARDVAGSLQGLVSDIKNGDWLGALTGVLDIIGQVAGMLGGKGSTATPVFGRGGGFSSFDGFRAAGGPVVPGKSYIVGENGPEWFTPGRGGRIIPNNDNSGGQLQIVPSPYFDVVVDGRVVKTAGPMAHQAASAGSAGAISRLTRRQARTFP